MNPQPESVSHQGVLAGLIKHATEAMDERHCRLPRMSWCRSTRSFRLRGNWSARCLRLELTEGTVIADRVGDIPCVFLAGLYRAERTVADGCCGWRTARCHGLGSMQTRRCLGSRRASDLPLAESQVAAIRLALISKVLITWRRQDHHRQGGSVHSGGQRGKAFAMRPDRPRRETHDRGDRRRS